MSDDLVKRLRSRAVMVNYGHGDIRDIPDEECEEAADRIEAQSAEIARLHTWRDAINGYLTEMWNSPLRDDETPLVALKRIVQLELISMALDPKILNSMNAALATARRQGMEDAAKRLEELHKNHGYDAKTGEVRRNGELVTCPLTIDHAIGYYRALAEGAAHILVAAKEGKP